MSRVSDNSRSGTWVFFESGNHDVRDILREVDSACDSDFVGEYDDELEDLSSRVSELEDEVATLQDQLNEVSE